MLTRLNFIKGQTMFYKVEVFIPENNVEQFIFKLNERGYLKDGPYDNVFAASPVMGHWRPLEGSHPHIGATNELSCEKEMKLEFRIKKADIIPALQIMKDAHPYEVPVINVLEILDWQFLIAQDK